MKDFGLLNIFPSISADYLILNSTNATTNLEVIKN